MQSLRIKNVGINETLFLIWWFLPLYYSLLIDITGANFVVIIRYTIYVLIFLYALYINKLMISRRTLAFFIIYLLIVCLNALLVSYRLDVFVEAITTFIMFITPVYLLSLSNFSLESAVKRGLNWGIFHTMFTVISILLTLGYGTVSTIATSNIVILTFGLFIKQNYRKKLTLICLVLNFIAIAIFGSRMPMIASVMTFIFLLLISYRKRIVRKTVLIFMLILLTFPLFLYFNQILNILSTILNNYGIKSRTLQLLLLDIGEKSILEMMHSSGREEIWTIASEYIVNRLGLPGGFGVIRHLTNGQIYFSHNVLLDLMIIFGVFTIPLIIWALIRFKRLMSIFSETEKLFLFTCAIFFLISSMTGAHFLNDRYAVITWSLLFFYRNTGGAKR